MNGPSAPSPATEGLRPILGAVLAGGRSRRFGRDKTLVEVDGVPMALRARQTLTSVCDDVVVVSSRPVPEAWGAAVPDIRPGLGPLAGIEAALTHAFDRGFSSVFVLAADLPRVDAGVVHAVVRDLEHEGDVELRRPGSEDPEQGGSSLAAAAARSGDPDFEPLCAIYRVECLGVASALLDTGERAARALVEALGGRKVVLDAGAAAAVALNVNVPDDLDRIP